MSQPPRMKGSPAVGSRTTRAVWMLRKRAIAGLLLGAAALGGCSDSPSSAAPDAGGEAPLDGGEAPLDGGDATVPGTWIPADDAPPPGASVVSTLVDGDVLYAVTPDTLWARAPDTPWARRGRLPASATLFTHPPLVAFGDALWFHDGFISWRSTDGGAAWTEIPSQADSLTPFGDQLFAMDGFTTVVWDGDAGTWVPWVESEWSTFEEDIQSMVATGSHLLRTANVDSFAGALLVLDPTQPHWNLAPAPEVAGLGHFLVQDRGSDSGLWSYVFDGGFDDLALLRSEDGVSWSQLGPLPPVYGFFSDLSLARAGTRTFLVGRAPGAPIYALDTGVWQPVPSAEIEPGARLRRLFSWDGSLFLSDAYGIHRLDGDAWVPQDDGLYQADPVTATDDFLFVQRVGRVYRRPATGGAWALLPAAGLACDVGLELFVPRLVASGTTVACVASTHLAVSLDQGETITVVAPPGDVSSLENVDGVPEGLVALPPGAPARLWSRTTGQWTLLPDPADFAPVHRLHDAGLLFSHRNDQGVARSAVAELGEMLWRPSVLPLAASGYPVGMRVDGAAVWLWSADTVTGAGALWRSADRGLTWAPVDLGLGEADAVVDLRRWVDDLLALTTAGSAHSLKALRPEGWVEMAHPNVGPISALVVQRERLILVTRDHGWLSWRRGDGRSAALRERRPLEP